MADTQNMRQMIPSRMPLGLQIGGKIIKAFSRTGEECDKMRLISIAISHYVEKVRWALELGSIKWTEDGHLPGLHSFFTTDVTGDRSMTPCLVTRDGNAPITDSTAILQYLCSKDPKLAFLYPEDCKKEVLEWEDYFDQELGVPVRRYAYSHILRNKELAYKVLTADLPWIERVMTKSFLPELIKGLTKMIAVQLDGDDAIIESTKKIDSVLDKVAERLKEGEYICGNSFSAADLTFASLFYPVSAAALPEMWDKRMPPIEQFPEAYQEQIAKWIEHPAGKHAIKMYKEHRFKPSNTVKKICMNNPNSRNNFMPFFLITVAFFGVGTYFLRSRI